MAPSSRYLQIRYLQLYNLFSAFAWLIVLGRVLLLVPLVGFDHVYGGVGTWVRWTQTVALLEIGHSAMSMFRHFCIYQFIN